MLNFNLEISRKPKKNVFWLWYPKGWIDFHSVNDSELVFSRSAKSIFTLSYFLEDKKCCPLRKLGAPFKKQGTHRPDLVCEGTPFGKPGTQFRKPGTPFGKLCTHFRRPAMADFVLILGWSIISISMAGVQKCKK